MDKELENAKSGAKDELDNFVEDASPEVEIIIDEAKNKLDDAESILEVDQILDDAKEAIKDQLDIEEFEDYQENAKSELEDYAGLNPNDGIRDILDQAYDDIDDAKTKVEVDDIITGAQEKIDEIKSRKTEITTDNYDEEKDYDELELEEDSLIGSVNNREGFEDDISLIVVKVELETLHTTKIEKYINEEKLNIYDNWINSSELKEQEIFGQLEIKLVDAQGNTVDKETYVGIYTVRFLLPVEMRDYINIRVVYLDSDKDILEVFNTTREGDWVSFETDHFSTFHLIGDLPPASSEVSVFWLIALLLVVIGVEVAVIVSFRRRISDDTTNTPKNVNSIVFPLLIALLPRGAWIIITIELIIILILLAYIIYLFIRLISIPLQEDVEELEEDVEELEEEVEVEPEEEVVPVAPVVERKVTRTINNYSFTSRLHLNDEETDLRYNDLKNHILSYTNVRTNLSWRQETFTVKGKMVVKLRLQGKTLRVYIGLEPKRFIDTKYNVVDNSNVKTHQTTPTLQVVRGPVQLMHAKELIDLYMKENEVEKNENYEEQDYTLKKLDRATLVEMELIKVQSAEFIEKVKTE